MKLVYMSVIDKELSDQRIERESFFNSPMKGSVLDPVSGQEL